MKQLEISRLMDEYQDNEFFPEDRSAGDRAAIKRRVLAEVKAEAVAKAPEQKKRPKKLLIAAGVAAVMAVLVGAGVPRMIYQLAAGTLTLEQRADSKLFAYVHDAPLMKLEEGRLYFVLDGQSIDITDQISEETPYIYDGSDPETGLTHYVILGGTPEGYGWLEWVVTPSPFTPVTPADLDRMIGSYEYQWITPAQNEQDERFLSGGVDRDAVEWDAMMDRPWLIAGAKQLHIPFVDPESGSDDIFYAPF